MKKEIDSYFAIAILALIASCVGFYFWLLNARDNVESIVPLKQVLRTLGTNTDTNVIATSQESTDTNTQAGEVIPQADGAEEVGESGEIVKVPDAADASQKVVVTIEMPDGSTWNKYSNEEFSFGLSYPTDWELIEFDPVAVDPLYEGDKQISFSPSLTEGGFTVLPRGGVDYGWGTPRKESITVDGKKAEYWYFNDDTTPRHLRMIDIPNKWGPDNRIEITTKDEEIIKEFVDSLTF